MRTSIRTAVFTLFLAHLVLAGAPAHAQAIPGCETGVLAHGAKSLICVPPVGWNGQLVVFAHGYVAVNEPLNFYHLTLPDGTSIPALVEGLGFAFATTSYRKNGLAVLEAVEDMKELVEAFKATRSVPLRTFVTGVSEGGLVTALLAERAPELVTSALSTCGPIGTFQGQIDSVGDFRVLFDYFFPGVIPGSPIDIPARVIQNWDAIYVPRIVTALASAPQRALELMATSRAAFDPADANTIARTTVDVLWYNVFGTNDAIQTLGGNPFDNRFRFYFGSSDDFRLNLFVRRVAASRAARAAVRQYETSGQLSIPLVTLHTTGDQVIPFIHELLYLAKVDVFNRGAFIPLPVVRYGHCNFTANEVLGAFLVTLLQP